MPVCEYEYEDGLFDGNYIGPPNSVSSLRLASPSDIRRIANGQQAINDFPLVNPAANPYVTKDQIIARLGGLMNLVEGTDDGSTGNVDTVILGNIIDVITTEINSYLGTVYDIPPLRIGTVATARVLTVDANGAILTIETEQPGYYQIKPTGTPIATVLRPLATDTLRNPDVIYGSGATLTCAFSAAAPFSLTAIPTVTSGGTKYLPYDRIGLVGGASYVPAKLNAAAVVLCCHALYVRRLASGENNQFDGEAKQWRKDLREIGNGDQELDAQFHRKFSPGAAWVSRDRLNMNSL